MTGKNIHVIIRKLVSDDLTGMDSDPVCGEQQSIADAKTGQLQGLAGIARDILHPGGRAAAGKRMALAGNGRRSRKQFTNIYERWKV